MRRAGETMKIAMLVAGVIGVLLGGLWMLQGLGIVQLGPILCFAECEAVQGPSPTWAIAGAVLLVAGAVAMVIALKRKGPPSPR